MVQRILPPTPDEDEQEVPAPSPVALPEPHEILQGILDPLNISNARKTSIWDAVLRPQYRFDHLKRILERPDMADVPDPVKTDIWNVKSGRMFPEYPLPTGGRRPEQIVGPPGLEEPVGPRGEIRQELPGLVPAEIVTEPEPVTGVETRRRVPLEPGVRGAPLVAPGPDIPPTEFEIGLRAAPPEATQVTPRPDWRKLPTPEIPPTPSPQPDYSKELITPKLESGLSPIVEVGGRKGRFNFDEPPETGGTPSPRYAFDTLEGGRWFYQLEKDYQGGRWENAEHAEGDFEHYKTLPSGARKTMLERMWQGDAGIVKAIDDAAAAGKSFSQLKADLAPFNTHRQISTREITDAPAFTEMSRELQLGERVKHFPQPIVKELTPYKPEVDEAILNRSPSLALMEAKMQGPFVRWESHPNAQQMYEGILELPDEERRQFLANRFWQQPEVNAAINIGVQYKVPWEDLTDFLADFDTTPPRMPGPLRVDAPLPPVEEREPNLTLVPWQFHEPTKRLLKAYKDLWPEKTEDQLMEEFKEDIGRRGREKNLWEFWSREFFTPGGLYERTPYQAKDLVNFTELVTAYYAVEAGKATDRQEQLLIDYYNEVEEAQIRGSTMPYEIARIATYMPAFMVEIYTSGGAYTYSKTAAKKAARELLLRNMPRMGKMLAQRQAKRRARQEAGGVAVGFARRAMSFGEDAAGRGLVLFPTRGTVTGFQRILHGEDKDLLPAMWHGYLDTTIEVFSELAGAPAGVGLSKVWHKLPLAEQTANLKNAIVYRWLGKTGRGAGEALNLLQKAGYHGMLMEIGEERLGEALRAATQLRPYEMPNLRQLIVEATAFSFPGLGALAMQVAERNNRDEQQRLAEDIEFFGELATQGLTREQVYNRAPDTIREAIDQALAEGETLEDLIDIQDVQTPVHGIRTDIPRDSVIYLPGVKQPRGGEEERRWKSYWKGQEALTGVGELPISEEDKQAIYEEGTKRDAASINEGFEAAQEIWNAYDEGSPEREYTQAYASWRFGEEVPFPVREDGTPWFDVSPQIIRVVQEDIDGIADQLDIAPWRAPVSEELAEEVPLPPEIQSLVDSLPEDQRAEAAINPGYYIPIETGEPFATIAYRGEGASLEEIFGPGSVERGFATPIAGPAQYYSFTPDHASRYGDEITQVDVDLENPLVLDNDQQWFNILDAAGAHHLSTSSLVSRAEPEGLPVAARRLQAWIRDQGYDGIIVKIPEMSDESIHGQPASRLRDSWEHSQIVVFDVQREEVIEPEDEAEPPVDTGERAFKLAVGQYSAGLETNAEKVYAGHFMNFKLGLAPDPGAELPFELAGPIRMQIEALATQLGTEPDIVPEEIPPPPEEIPVEAAPPEPVEVAPPEEVPPEPEVEALPPTPEEETVPTDEAVTPEEATSPHMDVAEQVTDILEAGENIDNPRLTQIANEAFEGERGEGAYDPRDAYDAAEVGLNRVLRRSATGIGGGLTLAGIVDYRNPETTVEELRKLQGQMPRQSDRTDEAVEMQQFSTPPELAFVATYVSGGWQIPRVEALEPSAGTGSLATMMELGGMNVTANEIAPRRAQLLRDQGFRTTEYDAEFLHSVIPEEAGIRPDIIVMNPPFSATGGRTASHATKYGAKHVKEALARLNEGGRLVAIVGQGMAMDRPGFSEWWDRIGDQYTIRANVGMSGKHYGKWGTSFGQQLLVIDKIGPTPGDSVAQRLENIIMGEDLSPQEALSLLEPLATEDISGRLAERPTEEGVRGAPGAIPPPPGPGVEPPPRPDIVRPEGRPERGDQPTPGVRGPTEREDLGIVEPGVEPGPEEAPGRAVPGYGERGRERPGGPGGTTGVGGLPGGGDLRRSGPEPGLEEESEFGTKNTVFKKEDADEALKRIRQKLKSQLDMGMDPDMMKDVFKVGGYLFEGGLRTFAEWSKKMLELLGDAVRPVLQSVFDTVKGYYEASTGESGARFLKEHRQSLVDEVDPYSKYVVQKARFEGSQEHPANIVESSILASVEPPAPTYAPDLPEEVITEGRLSDLQLEAVSYIGQRHGSVYADGSRAAFWLGDGTGLGKGRIIAGTIWDNWRQGRTRALWVSVNHTLGSDAIRDIEDIGAPMKVIRQKDRKYTGGKPIDDVDGVLFTAYSMASYRINGERKRFNQIVDWLGPDFDGVIAFDESHLLKNALKGDRSGEGVEKEGGTQSGRMAAMLEDMYPKARFVYVSATGATVPRNMGYMTRLGLWGPGRPFPEFIQFLQAMQRGGLGAMEMLSRDLKSIGAYMSRIISYEGVGYETITHELTPMEVDAYNKAADIWQELITEFEAAQENANQPKKGEPGVWSAFYGGQQRFFLQYMMSLKLPDLFAEATKDLALGKTIVINLFNTNEQLSERLVAKARAEGISVEELDFTPKEMIVELIEKYFPLIEYVDSVDPKTGKAIKIQKMQTEIDPVTGKERETDKPVLNRENLEKQAELLEKLADVTFPENPLDAIVNHFGVENISEVSGRYRRIINGEQVIRRVKGVRREDLNEYETAQLQDGVNRVAVITGSAATGISMHSDLSKKNQQQRVFYAFQLNWSADKQLQSFGRVHRSHQASSPIYKLLRTNLKSEERIVNATARRLAGLGALTTGSREALAGGLFEIEDLTDVYGEAALVVTYDDIFKDRVEGVEGGPELIKTMGMMDGNGNVDKQHSSNVNRFLNRIMALHVDVQNRLFNKFYDHYQRVVQMAKDEGSYDMGIQPIRDRNFNKPIGVTLKQKPNNPEVVHVDKESGAETLLVDLNATYPVQKVTYEDAQKMGGTANRGFWVNVRSKKIYTAYPTNRTKWYNDASSKGFEGNQPVIALTNPKGRTHEVGAYQLEPGQNFQPPDEFRQTQFAHEEMLRRKELREAEEKRRRPPFQVGEKVLHLGGEATVIRPFRARGVDMVELQLAEGTINIPADEVFRPGEVGIPPPPEVPTPEFTPQTREVASREMWEAELALIPDTEETTVTMLVGAVTPIYDKVIGSGEGALRRLRVVRTVLDDGTAYVGMHIQANEVGGLKERLGIGTPLGSATPRELFDMVEAGATIELDNGWRMRMTKVHGETRMELDARGRYHKEELRGYGLIEEILQYKRRFFIPLDNVEGPKVIGAITELHNAVRDITTRGGGIAGDVLGDTPGATEGLGTEAGDLSRPGETVAGDMEGEFEAQKREYDRVSQAQQGIPPTPSQRAAREIPPVPGEVPEAEFTPAEARAAKLPGNIPINELAKKLGVSYEDAREYVLPADIPVTFDAFPDEIPADLFSDPDDPILGSDYDRDMYLPVEPEWTDKGVPISYPDVYEAYEQILIALGKHVPIRVGRFRNKARGIFKIFTEVIRINKANNIPTAAHEIGHAIEKAVYGWEQGEPSPWVKFMSPGVRAELNKLGKALYGKRRPYYGYDREGWAEFMRYYLTGDLAEEQAPRTYRWFTETFLIENPDIAEPIDQAKTLTTHYRLQGAKMRAKGGIVWGQEKTNRFLNMMKDMSYQNWVEMLSPLEHMSRVAERLLGEPLQPEEDPYLTARARRLTAGGKVNTMVHRSMIDIAGNKVGPPLNDIEALVQGQQDEFAWYLWARRAQERWQRNKDPGMSKADADYLVEELESPNFLLAAQMFYDWHKGLMNYARQGGLLNKKSYDLILEGSHDYMPLYRVFDEVDQDFVKQFEGRGRMGGGNAFPFMKGKRGGRIRDPFTVSVEKARRIVVQTDQRIVLQQIMRMGADPWMVDGMGIEIEEVPRDAVPVPITIEQTLRQLAKEAKRAEEKKQINALLGRGIPEAIAGAETMDQLVEKLKEEFADLEILGDLLTFFIPAQRPKGSPDPIVPITDREGRIRWFQVPNKLYRLLEGLDVYRLKPTMDLLLGTPTRVMRMSTTALRPVFALWRNPIKDFQTFLMHTQSDAKPHMLLQEWLTTMTDIVRNGEDSPYFAQFLRFGLEAGTQLGQDVKQTKRAVEGLFQTKWQRRIHSPVDAYRDFLSIPEMGTRVTELKLMADKVGWKPGEQMTFHQSIVLANAAKKASVDFTAAGAVGRKFNQMAPFFNANVQGNRQFYENMRDRPRRTILWGMTWFTIPTLMLWWVNKDEEWYRDMPWWERFTYWNLGKLGVPLPIGTGRWEIDIGIGDPELELPYIYQIPRAFEWGAAFSALPEALFDSVYENDPEGVKQVFGHLFRTVMPISAPPSLEVPLEIGFNRDSWTWNRIIPQRETNWPPSEQKGKYTSRLATWLSRIFPDVPYLGAPRVWDHAIRGFFGGLGPDLLETAGLAGRPFGHGFVDVVLGPEDDTLPAASWLWFATRRGGKKAARSKVVDEFYEEWNRYRTNYEFGRVKAQALGSMTEDEQQRFSAKYQWPETPERRRYRLQLNDAHAAMSLLNFVERNTDNFMQIETIRQIQVALAREALDDPNKVAMTDRERKAYEAQINAMTISEQRRYITEEYIKSNILENDPESIWGKARALGIPDDEVGRLIDNTTVQLQLAMIARARPGITQEEAKIIDDQILILKERRAIERLQSTPARARSPIPPISPTRIPPPPAR